MDFETSFADAEFRIAQWGLIPRSGEGVLIADDLYIFTRRQIDERYYYESTDGRSVEVTADEIRPATTATADTVDRVLVT